MSLAGRIVRSALGIPNARWASYTPAYIDKPKELAFLREEIRAYSVGQYLHLAGPIPLDNFSGETVEMRTGYRRALLAEPAIKAAMIGKVAAVQALGLNVRPYSKNSPLDAKVADWVKHAIQSARGGLPQVIETITIPGLVDGWSVNEKVWRWETRGEFAGKIGLDKLKAKDTRYISLRVDPYRNVEGVISLRGNTGEMYPPSDFVLFNYLSLFESPFGNSDLRASYRAAAMIPQILNLRMIFLDKYTGPFLTAKVADPALVSQMKKVLADARQGGFAVLTPEDELEVLDLATRGTSDFLEALKDLREEVAMSISGAFLHMLTGEGQSGQRGSAAVQQDQVDLFIWLLAVKVAACLNEQLVPDLVNANYGSNVGLPVVALEAPNPEAIVAELKIDEMLAGLNVPLSLEDLYERAGRRPPRNPADTVQVPQGSTDFFANATRGLPTQPGAVTMSEPDPAAALLARRAAALANGNGVPH